MPKLPVIPGVEAVRHSSAPGGVEIGKREAML